MTASFTNMIEVKRISLQKELDKKKTQAERNKLGQFSTPPDLAASIVKKTLEYFSEDKKIKFLDPAFGTGAFGTALLKVVNKDKIEKGLGCEIDKHYWQPSVELWRNTKIESRLCDFTTEPPPNQNKFNLLICNPPYVRHHHINGKKDFLQQKVFSYSGMKLSGLAGLYCYFIGLSHAWLEEDAISAWLIPSEFMNVKYGHEIERYLSEEVSLLQIHRFDPEDVQFEDALVSSAVVWFKKKKPANDHEVLFTYGGTIEKPRVSKYISLDVLKEESKWTRFPLNEQRKYNKGELRIGDYFDIKRGIATGANSFFILSEKQVEELNLPFNQLKPILPSPRYLKDTVIESDKKGYPNIEKRLFVIDSNLSMDKLKEKYPSLYNYLQLGIEKGIDKKYLCSKRKIWYSQEQRPPSMFYCTYIGRTGDKKPFRFILNFSQAIVNNSYQNLYPKPFVLKLIEQDPFLSYKIIEELNKITDKLLLDEGRVYGGGMHKLEPRELANVSVDDLATLLGKPPGKS